MPLFIAAGIAAAGSVGGALIGANATSNAAQATQASAAAATAEQARQFNIGQSNQQPWLTTGQSALSKLATLYGLDSYTNPPPGSANGAPGNPTLAQANPVAGQGVGGAPVGTGGDTPGVMAAKAAGPHSQNGTGSELPLAGVLANSPIIGSLFKTTASPIQDISAALSQGKTITDAQWAQAGFGPGGSSPGSANGAPSQPGTFTPGSSQPGVDPNASFYQSPDYAFRLKQGIAGTDAGAAARGALDSGATRKAEIGYAGNLASGEFNNYANRLSALAGVGQTTATNTANQGQNYANTVGNIAVNQGNNLASSYLAKGQTYGNTIGQLAGIGSGLITNQPTTYNPAAGGIYNGAYLAPANSSAAAAGY